MDIAEKPEIIQIRVKGTVQGVGFRPTVWRLANNNKLAGEVSNDAEGVLIEITGNQADISQFIKELPDKAPPLSTIESIDIQTIESSKRFTSFQIIESKSGSNQTRVTADAGTCVECVMEILNPEERRFFYPFTNCTHCGPRLTIVQTIPYDRINTTMDVFTMCEDCKKEYTNPADRRFHAQPIACHVCGPTLWLEDVKQPGIKLDAMNDTKRIIDRLCYLLEKGKIIAIRGLGGFHLCCDATNDYAVTRLRNRKYRYAKPFALMAYNVEMIEQYCQVNEIEKQLLESPESPIVLLSTKANNLPESISPGSNLLGFMRPYTPLHLLISKEFAKPLVMTSGNLSDEPQITDNESARIKLREIADILLLHNREIANRIDDSVVRIMANKPRLLRRARGYAPRPIPLPGGFEKAPDITAFGGSSSPRLAW